jgi:hypothetical protein
MKEHLPAYGLYRHRQHIYDLFNTCRDKGYVHKEKNIDISAQELKSFLRDLQLAADLVLHPSFNCVLSSASMFQGLLLRIGTIPRPDLGNRGAIKTPAIGVVPEDYKTIKCKFFSSIKSCTYGQTCRKIHKGANQTQQLGGWQNTY